MERTYYYKVYYSNKIVCTITAHSIYEAIDRTYQKYSGLYPEIDRKLFTAVKIY